MTDEVFNMMICFPDSYVTAAGEVVLDNKRHMTFTVRGVETKEDIVYKLLEWCSRPIAKECPYSSEQRNREWRRSLLLGLNLYLDTKFTEGDMWVIYDRLGNKINHDLTVKFVESGFDMEVLKHEAD